MRFLRLPLCRLPLLLCRWLFFRLIQAQAREAVRQAVLAKNILAVGALANAVCSREVSKVFGGTELDNFVDAANLRQAWQNANTTDERDLSILALAAGRSAAPAEDNLDAHLPDPVQNPFKSAAQAAGAARPRMRKLAAEVFVILVSPKDDGEWKPGDLLDFLASLRVLALPWCVARCF